ncbi:MAG: alkaline phosphatase family protein [Chloroflexia bacterium]|nr:alkaline phosphatase family protein [Chloroflexia bacterium]
MALFRKFRKRSRPRLVVIGLDGTPYTYVQKLLGQGQLPHFARLLEHGSFARIHSVYPTVSSVAWSSYMTGVNPARHGIFGFIDRRPGSYQTTIPTSQRMQAPTLWEILSQADRRVIVMNVPVTYPPRQVNGLLVGGFLSPKLEKATYPPELAGRLARWGYRIDADPWKARQSKDLALQEVNDVLERRARSMFKLMDEEEWDFFQCHVMETDRLFHFLWQEMEEEHPDYAPRFLDFMQRIDRVLGELWERLDEETSLVVLSDHGFCTLKKEVYINTWLQQRGWLRLREGGERPKLEDLSDDSVAYSLDPGRVFIHLAGREPRGPVQPGAEYEALRGEIAAAALELRDPDDGSPMVRQVFKREEIYYGPLLEQAADLILVPFDGYDLKGPLGKPTLTFKGEELVGMHTYDDAMLYVQGQEIAAGDWGVVDVMPTVLQLLDVPRPAGLDGSVCLSNG